MVMNLSDEASDIDPFVKVNLINPDNFCLSDGMKEWSSNDNLL